MILEIRFSNFFSFKEEVILDLRAAGIKTKQATDLRDNVFEYRNEKLLKTIAIYGANASGKSNLIKTIRFCCRMILESHMHNENTRFNFQPFKLEGKSTNEPSSFFIRFVSSDVEYEYSFTLTNNEILTETLYHYPKGRIAKIFTRDESISDTKSDIYSFGSVIRKPLDVAINTSNKTLYISRASQMDRDVPKQIFNYFSSKFLLAYVGLRPDYILDLFKTNRELILKTLQIADSDIVNIEMSTEIIPLKTYTTKFGVDGGDTSMEKGLSKVLRIKSYHKANPEIPFDFATEESNGTRKLFDIILRLIDVVKSDKILLIDEIDTSLHTDIVEFIINFFYASKRSQLIFTTHNTNLIDLKKMRKDQIYFVNKRKNGSSELYSLYDFKDFRDSMDAEKGYLQGRFEAIPFLDDSMSSLKSLIDA